MSFAELASVEKGSDLLRYLLQCTFRSCPQPSLDNLRCSDRERVSDNVQPVRSAIGLVAIDFSLLGMASSSFSKDLGETADLYCRNASPFCDDDMDISRYQLR